MGGLEPVLFKDPAEPRREKAFPSIRHRPLDHDYFCQFDSSVVLQPF